MEKTNKNEELQSRREFFKKAAKGALPILAAVVLASSPNLLNAASKAPMGCSYRNCEGGCSATCYGTCKGSCNTSCQTYCKGTCKGTCSGKCTSSNKY